MTTGPILVAKSTHELSIFPQMANRHGLIAGATGTGKSVTLKVMAEGFSREGVPVFLADVKGDLAGMSQQGKDDPKISERVQKIGIPKPAFQSFPTVYFDLLGEQGHPVRATVSDMGPLLLSRLLNLNETQSGVLSIAFKVADDNGMLLLDLKDLQAMIQHIGDNPKDYISEYGNVSTASVGAIQRAILTIREQGAEKFFGEPALSIDDLMQTDSRGYGVVNILAADKLMEYPKLYSTFLLWLLSELFEQLPEAGDLDKPKLVFFFDEAHLLFDEAPKVLHDKIEQVVRLIRSKGVGVYFVSQSSLDIPDDVLGQLGNRVQHALRAFTAKDQKTVRATAETFRNDTGTDLEKAITELSVGEALVSFLDEQGSPRPAERAWVIPPSSRMGPVTPDERRAIIQSSTLFGHYENAIDRESAYERLKQKTTSTPETREAERSQMQTQKDSAGGAHSGGRSRQGPLEAFITSTARAVGSQVGRQIFRGVLGSILGKSSR